MIVKVDDFQTQINDFQKKVEENVNTKKSTQFGRGIAWGIISVVLLVFIFYIALMACSYTGKCYTISIILQAVLMVLVMLVTFLLCFIAFGSKAIAVSSSNACYFMGQVMTNETLATDIFKFIKAENMKKYYDVCLGSKGTGDLRDLLPIDQLNKIKDLDKLVDGFNIDINSLNISQGSDLKSKTISTYKIEFLQKWYDWSLPDYAENVNDSPEKAITSINSQVSCIANSPNEFVLNPNQCKKTPKSTPSDLESNRVSLDYCLIAPGLGYSLMTSRYTTEASCAVPAHATYNQLRVCTDQHKSLLEGMISDLGTGPDAKSQVVYQGLNQAVAKIAEFKAALVDILSIVSNTNGFTELFNCQVLRVEIRNTIGNICFRFVDKFSKQALLLGMIGPLFLIFGCCICCSYLQAKVHSEGREGKRLKKDAYAVKNNISKQSNDSRHENKQLAVNSFYQGDEYGTDQQYELEIQNQDNSYQQSQFEWNDHHGKQDYNWHQVGDESNHWNERGYGDQVDNSYY